MAFRKRHGPIEKMTVKQKRRLRKRINKAKTVYDDPMLIGEQ
jgi:hypothetical protein